MKRWLAQIHGHLLQRIGRRPKKYLELPQSGTIPQGELMQSLGLVAGTAVRVSVRPAKTHDAP